MTWTDDTRDRQDAPNSTRRSPGKHRAKGLVTSAATQPLLSEAMSKSEYASRLLAVLAARGILYDTGQRRRSKRPPHNLRIVWAKIPGVTDCDFDNAFDEIKQDMAAGRL
jgi:hypothetical protein